MAHSNLGGGEMFCKAIVRDLLTVVLAIASVSARADIWDFETYNAGQTVSGVDGWTILNLTTTWSTVINDPSQAIVTPIFGGEQRALSGSQSLALYDSASYPGSSPGTALHLFSPGTVLTDGTIIQAEMMVDGLSSGSGPDETNMAGFFFSQGVAAGLTPVGIEGHPGGNFWLFGDFDDRPVGEPWPRLLTYDSGVACVRNNKYLLEVTLNFTNQSSDCFATDLTTGGSRTFLGTAPWAAWEWDGPSVERTIITPASAIPNGGFILGAWPSVTVALFDNVGIVPEPSSLVLLLTAVLGLMACAWRRHNGA